MDKQTISTFKKDQSINGEFAVKNKRAPIAYARGWRFEMLLGDATGSIALKFWGGPDENKVRQLYESIAEGGVIAVSGRVNEFNGKLELSVTENDTLRALAAHEYDAGAYLPVSTQDIEMMWKELKGIMDAVKDPTCATVLRETFKDPAFVERFKKAPAAMHMHHAWIGGLLEHTLTLTRLCERCATIYPTINHDLLVTGTILHDLGKLQEYETSTTIRTTPIGVLVGHLVLESGRLLAYRGTSGIDDNMLLKITHMVVSHHGSTEKASPKNPAIPEAILLSAMDALDCSMVRTLKLINEADPDTFETYDPKESRTVYLK